MIIALGKHLGFGGNIGLGLGLVDHRNDFSAFIFSDWTLVLCDFSLKLGFICNEILKFGIQIVQRGVVEDFKLPVVRGIK